jgi:hypothetical protein
MHFQEIFPAIDEAFGAPEGTAEQDLRHKLDGSQKGHGANLRLDSGDWNVSQKSGVSASISRGVAETSHPFTAAVTKIELSEIDKEAAAEAGASFKDPAQLKPFIRKRIAFSLKR